MTDPTGYRVAVEDVPRVARALEATREMLGVELDRHQCAIITQALLSGRAVVMRCGDAHRLWSAGVLAPAVEQPLDEKLIALVPSVKLVARMDPPPPALPPRRQNPRREVMRVLRDQLNLFEGGAAAWADVEAAVAALRDVVSRQCCERDNDLDGNCDVHREPWRPKV